MKGRTFLLVFTFLVCFIQVSAQIDHWETVIVSSQEWTYFPGTSQPPDNWKEINFNDSSWGVGQGGIGYGDDDDVTVIEPVLSLYMRRIFTLSDTSTIKDMLFHIDYDDAFVAYINGIEVTRAGINGNNPPFNQPSDGLREATMYAGGVPQPFNLNFGDIKLFLKEGVNVLAIQVHNQDINSSDLSAIPFLSVAISDNTFTYQETPDWFVPPVEVNQSILPIVKINTFGNYIQNEERIHAELGIIDNGPGMTNHITDSFNNYHGWISIEIRGESSTMFPKKSFSLETQDSLGENRNVSLLGFPEENDWILYAPYSDKTLIKNALSYHLARGQGRYASRTKYVELFINDDYVGLYVLMEKIKRDKNRVDISKLNEIDIEGDQLTGGYIIRVDKVDENDYPPWEAIIEMPLQGESIVSYAFFDPSGWELQMEQQNYIKNYMRAFEYSLVLDDFLDPVKGYRQFTDIPSFVDYLIINEISKNIDAYIFSTYMYKDRDSKGGKLHMGPAWDFNIGYGNLDYNEQATLPEGWMYEEGYRMYWFRRMMQDPVFSNKLSCRWHELRSDVFQDENIFGYIDSLVVALENPIKKNFQRWPILSTYVWPNNYIGNTHEAEIDNLKTWLTNRLIWMDGNIPETCVTGINAFYQNELAFKIFPNPFENEVTFKLPSNNTSVVSISIFNLKGKLIKLINNPVTTSGNYVWDGKNATGNPVLKGLYIAQIETESGRKVISRLIKK